MDNIFKSKFKIDELLIKEFEYWVVTLRPWQPTIGSLVLSLKRTCKHLSDISSDESKELKKCFSEIESYLSTTFNYDKINYLCLMMVDEHVHFHVIPRYENEIIFNEVKFVDTGWPGPPDLSDAIKDDEVREDMLLEIKQKIINNT